MGIELQVQTIRQFLGLEVVFGSTEDCVESAIVGRVVRDEGIWADA